MIAKTFTQMTSKVFDKLNSFVLFFLPEFDMAVLAGCDDKVSSKEKGK